MCLGSGVPLLRGGAIGDIGPLDRIHRVGVIGNPQFGCVAPGNPEVVISGDRRRKVSPDPTAVVFTEISRRFERGQVARPRGSRRCRDCRHRRPGHAAPILAHDRCGRVVLNVQIHDGRS